MLQGTNSAVKEIGTGPRPIVFANSPDRLSAKLFCQPLPLIDKSRFSVNSTNYF